MARKSLTGLATTVGSGVSSRPPNPVGGQQHWRADKNFMETYDGTAWRVFGTVVVSSLADITSPYEGQLVVHSGDSFRTWRRTSSTWVLYNSGDQPVGGEWLGVTADNITWASVGYKKLNISTNLVAPVGGVTRTGSIVTVPEDGHYNCSLFARINNTSGVYVAIDSDAWGGTQYANVGPGGTGSGNEAYVGGDVWLTAGQQVRPWVYANTASGGTDNATRNTVFRVWKTHR